MRSNLIWLAVVALAGCGPDTVAPPDLGNAVHTVDMSLPKRDTTDHPKLLTMDNNGGALLTAIEVYTIVWKGDEALGQQVQDYTDWLVKSDEFWIASLGEYGIGKGTAPGFVVLPDAKPTTIDDTQLSKLISDRVASGTLPAPTANKTLYQLVIPASTTQTMFGGSGCKTYDGYHSEVKVTLPSMGPTFYLPYSINLQCPGQDFSEVQATLSHEAAEAATDPHPSTDPGYRATGGALGGENADLCNPLANTYRVDRTVDGGALRTFAFTASRNWSNASATAGDKDPCQPAPKSAPYYNTAIDPSDPTFTSTGDPKGTDYMLRIEPFAFGDVGKIKWALAVNPPAGVTITPTSGENMPGETVWMTVHVDNNAQSGSSAFLVASQAMVGGINYWQTTLTIQ